MKQESHWQDSIGSTAISSSGPHWMLPMSKTSMKQDTGLRPNTPDRAWRQRRQTQLFGTRSVTSARRQSVSDTSTETSRDDVSWRNWDFRSYALPITRLHVASTARNLIVMNTS